jgi:hypothetical protein
MIAKIMEGTLGALALLVEAPVKARALIKNAGHFAAFTRPDQFLTELLTHVHPLARAPAL